MTDPHAAHLDAQPPQIAERLRALQAEIERRIPDAQRCVSYRMPAWRRTKVFLYLAAFKGHIGVYPPVKGPPDLLARLATYRGPKGNLAFPHGDALPVVLIGDVAERLAEDYG